jgi:hypothetical protein
MNELKHPRALAIAKRGESALWDMGDYLIEVAGASRMGRPTSDRTNATVSEVSAELVEQGFEQYSLAYMTSLRNVANAFPKVSRCAGVSFFAHRIAGTPEVLQAVMAAAKAQGRAVSGPFVNLVMKGMDADQRAKRKGVQIRAEKAADRAEKRGDKEAAERNRTRARKLKGAPKPDKSRKPEAAEVPLMLVKSKFMADSATAKTWVKRMDRDISPHIDELTKAFVVGSVEELLEIAELYRKLAAKLNRNQTEKRAHLHAVA